MKYILVTILACSLLLTFGCKEYEKKRSAYYTVDTFTLSNTNFDAIEMKTIGNVVLSRGDSFSIKAVSTKFNFDRMLINQNGSRLIINKKNKIRLRDVQQDVIFYITMPTIKQIVATGVAEVKSMDTFTSEEEIAIAIKGAANIDLKLSAPKIIVSTSGGSDIALSGMVDSLEVKVSGAASIEALELVAKNANIVSSGFADIRLSVTDNLVVNTSGASNIDYRGNPKITKNTSAVASINQISDIDIPTDDNDTINKNTDSANDD